MVTTVELLVIWDDITVIWNQWITHLADQILVQLVWYNPQVIQPILLCILVVLCFHLLCFVLLCSYYPVIMDLCYLRISFGVASLHRAGLSNNCPDANGGTPKDISTITSPRQNTRTLSSILVYGQPVLVCFHQRVANLIIDLTSIDLIDDCH